MNPTVAKYANQNLSYVGKIRLSKLSEEDLRELWRLVAVKLDPQIDQPEPPHGVEIHVLVEGILKMKTSIVVKPKELRTTDVDTESRLNSPVEPVDPVAAVKESTEAIELIESIVPRKVSAFVEMHSLTICSWNSLELRIGNMKGKHEDGSMQGDFRRQQWLSFVQKLSEYDVIVMQEILATEASHPKCTKKFTQWLHMYSEPDVKWNLHFSEPSGKDGKVTGTGVHVHACWVRGTVEVLSMKTLFEVGGTRLDYAPLQLLLRDTRFSDANYQKFVVTSVHLPPCDRADARDIQLKKLISCYTAMDTTEYRMLQPFGPNLISAHPPVHVVCGDFNVFPGSMKTSKKDIQEDMYGTKRHGFIPMLPEQAATSQGHNHYDNFLVDMTSTERFLICESILPLDRTEKGLSDHDPVVLTIQEMRNVTKSSNRADKKKLPSSVSSLPATA